MRSCSVPTCRYAGSIALAAAALAAATLAGCASQLPPAAFDGAAPEMRPETFFAGKTSSSGVIEDRAGAPTSRFRVEGTGKSLADGTFQLDQVVSFPDEGRQQTRTWLMQRLDAHRYTATLTDASGPVEAEVHGNLMHLRYPMKTPFGGRMEQWLYLQPDDRTVVNEATVRVFGLVAAHLSERITRELR